MLAQVDEREPQRAGVGPAEGALHRPSVAEDVGGHHGCREVQGGHGGEGIASQDIVERAPGALPDGLSVFAHQAAHARAGAARSDALLGRVPRRRGGERPVADEPEVEDRVDLRGAAGQLVAAAGEQVGDGPVRDEEPQPVAPHERLLGGAQRLALAAREGALQPQAGQLAEADGAVGDHGVAHAHPRAQALGIVVGHLVGRDVGVHLQAHDRDVTQLRAAHGHGQRERRRASGGDDHGRREAKATADERRGRPEHHCPPRGRTNGARTAHRRRRGYRRRRTPGATRRSVGTLLYKGSVPSLHEGDEFAGHRILGIAGRGGMGVVYRAIQLDLDRPVALKLIAPQLAEDPDFRERFVRESRAAASIDHPNVIPIYYTGESDDGALYIAMRYVEGSDLRTLVRAEQRLDPARAAYIVSQVGAGARRRARARHRPPRRQARQRAARRQRPRLPHRLRADQARDLAHAARRATAAGSARSATSRPSRSAASASTPAPTSTRWAACSTTRSRACRPTSARATRRRCGRTSTTIRRRCTTERPTCPRASTPSWPRAMAKDPDDRFPSAGDLGRAALAAAGEPVAPGPERVVARRRGRPRRPARRPSSPPTRRPRCSPRATPARAGCWPWALAVVPIAGLALIAALALGGGGNGGGDGPARRRRSRPAPSTTTQPQNAAIKTVDVGGRPEQHRPGQRQGVGRAQRQRAAGGDRRQDRQARALQPARRATPAARPPASASCGSSTRLRRRWCRSG